MGGPRHTHSIWLVHQLPSPDSAIVMQPPLLAQYLLGISSVWLVLELALVKYPYRLTGKRLGAIPRHALANGRLTHTPIRNTTDQKCKFTQDIDSTSRHTTNCFQAVMESKTNAVYKAFLMLIIHSSFPHSAAGTPHMHPQ